MAGALAEIIGNALIRSSLTAADIATEPKFFDFIGDGTGTGKPNTCILNFGIKEGTGCVVNTVCNGVTTNFDWNQEACVINGAATFFSYDFGDFRIDFGPTSKNQHPFPGQPFLYVTTLEGEGNPDPADRPNLTIGQCDAGKGDQQGMFTGTACDSDAPIYLKVCNTNPGDNGQSYMYHIALPTSGSYACNTGSKKVREIAFNG